MKTLTVDSTTLHVNPVHRGLRLVKELRDAGIPAFGSISLEGVESGTLSIASPDLVTGEVVYSWRDDKEVAGHSQTLRPGLSPEQERASQTDRVRPPPKLHRRPPRCC